MGIEPFLLASTLNTVIGQRLVRRVSRKRTTHPSNEMQTNEINQLIGHLLPQSPDSVINVIDDFGYPGLPVVSQAGYNLVEGVDDQESPGG